MTLPRASINNGVAVACSLPVLRVVVAVTNAKGSHDCTELGHLDFFSTNICTSLGKAGTELTRRSLTRRNRILFPSLSVVGKHLLERVSTALTFTEVRELNCTIDDALFLATALARLRRGR